MEEVSEGIHVPKVYSSPECDGRLFQAVKAKPLRFRRGTLMDKGQVSLLGDWRHATASWTYLFRMIKSLSSPSNLQPHYLRGGPCWCMERHRRGHE